jgi:hypothetical protein
MPPVTPHVRPMPLIHRKFLFSAVVILFFTLVPLLVFYAVGYRFDFSGGGIRNILSVGGMYINIEAQEAEIFIDDEPVEDLRIFQRAAYVQNLESGMHQVHVQGEGLQTWVKKLPVFAHFVTEVASFNMPVVPQVRFITQFQTTDGAVVIDGTSTPPFTFASTTQQLALASSTVATSTYIANTEFSYVVTRFASTTEERQLIKQIADFAEETFAFTQGKKAAPTTTATTTISFQDMELHQRGEEVYATWRGGLDAVPYYFCVNPNASTSATSSVALHYGDHIAAQLIATASTTRLTADQSNEAQANRVCRTEVRIDRKWQTVLSFAFLPNSRDHVLMHLTDGLYVVEIDDRSWQNTQLLYPGRDLTMLVDGNRILVKDGELYLEVFTELQ